MRKFLSIILLIVLTFLYNRHSQAQQLGFSLADDAKRVRIPFEVYNNLVVVPVILNNQLPLKFIIDTGVRTSILTEKTYGDILNLKYSKKYTISGLGGEQLVDAYITNNVTLTLPGVKGRGHALLVLAEDYLELRNYLGTDVHGILGYELFSRFIVTMDYDKRIMTLTTPRYFKPKRKYKEIPMAIEDTKPYIYGYIMYKGKKAKEVKLMVDTGASHGLRLEADSDPEIVVPDPNIEAILGRGLGGVMNGKMARIKMLHLGDGICWENVITSFPSENDFLDSLRNIGIFRNGSIGGEILSRFSVTFDFPEGKLYLKRGKQFKKAFSYNLSGLTVKAIGSQLNTYEIIEVRKNSVGEQAGFKVGDKIVAINNIDAKNLHLNNIVGFLNAKENKKLKITVMRNGLKITHKFKLKSPI